MIILNKLKNFFYISKNIVNKIKAGLRIEEINKL